MTHKSDGSDSYLPELPESLKKSRRGEEKSRLSDSSTDSISPPHDRNRFKTSEKNHDEWKIESEKAISSILESDGPERRSILSPKKKKAGPPTPWEKDRDNAIENAVKEYNAIYNPVTLMEIHQKSIAEGKKPRKTSRNFCDDKYGSKNSSSFWERHSDAAHPRMTPQARLDAINKLSKSKSMFKSGSKRFL